MNTSLDRILESLHFQELANLRWRLVVEEKRYWTSLSVVVVGIFTSLLFASSRAAAFSLFLALPALFGVVLFETFRFLRARRELRRIKHRLAPFEPERPCRLGRGAREALLGLLF
jgi:hypothetical protein